jgi:lipopolysaccharide/colanic/teichoic acid biosynthesis glycosyltransferase
MKRLADVLVSACLLVLLSPLLVLIAVLIFAYDFHTPFYVALRVGRGGRPFHMIKFRSMVVGADRKGGTSTSARDPRITPVGHFVRKYKMDEIVQLWNVLVGDMSLVGPRPNVPSGVSVYTPQELRLLDVKPGITDFASIVFADEGEILRNFEDADRAYDQLIRPWKSRLGLFYIARRSMVLDLKLLWLTAVAVVSRKRALEAVSRELARRAAPADLVRVALRIDDLALTPIVDTP